MQLVLSPDILAEDYEAAAVLSTRYPAIAIAARVPTIVSGDKHLLA